VTEENQRHCEQQQSDASLRNDAVDEPLKQQGREQGEKAAGRDAEETGQVPVQKWPNLFHQPDEFSGQPVRASLLGDGGQRWASRMLVKSANHIELKDADMVLSRKWVFRSDFDQCTEIPERNDGKKRLKNNETSEKTTMDSMMGKVEAKRADYANWRYAY
jgi:hypothetical protein